MKLFTIVSIALALSSLGAVDNPLGNRLSLSDRRSILSQLNVADPQKRVPVIMRLRADAEFAKPDMAAALDRPENSVTAQLRRSLSSLKASEPSVDAIRTQLAAFNTAATAARSLVQTDHHKDQRKFAEMDRAFADAEKAYKHLSRLLKPGTPTAAVQFVDALQWTAEIRRDRRWCADKDSSSADLPICDVLEFEGAPPDLKAFAKELEPFLARREFNRLVAAAHAQMKWAKPDQIQYANLLNYRREVLGLRPFLLAEKLSAAAAQHSEEMSRLKYFSHESPIPENKTFGQRAKNAAFQGSPNGECIFAGGDGPSGAHRAWWYSDGHRLILYATNGDSQGIARFGSLWTFVSGSFQKFPI